MTDLEIATFIVMELERGFSNDPADAGGVTRWGITRPYLAAYLRVPVDEVSPSIIKNLAPERAVEVLLEVELTRQPLIKTLDWRPKLAVVDFNYNAGPDDGIPALQRAVGVKADGVFGPKTAAAALQADPLLTAITVTTHRMRVHAERSNRGVRCPACKLPSQKKFLGGWEVRCADILDHVTRAA